MRISDWSSDVCSSDLVAPRADRIEPRPHAGILGHVEIGVPAIPFALEIEAERGEDRLAHRLARRIALVALCLDRVAFAREEAQAAGTEAEDRKEHTSELQSLMRISYAVFCLKT